MLFDGDIIERGGRRFKVKFPDDPDMGPPWDDDCMYEGLVSERRGSKDDKAPGERCMGGDRRDGYRFFNVQEANARGKRDGWRLADKKLKELADKLGRTPTKGEVRAAAVEGAFDYLSGWMNDEWHWSGVVVTLLDDNDHETDETEAVWGVSDADYDYQESEAMSFADQINYRLDKEAAEARYWAERGVVTKG